MLTQEILQMLFDELGMDFDAWVEETNYSSSWSDQQIYNALPSDIQAECGDILMNASWYHGGM